MDVVERESYVKISNIKNWLLAYEGENPSLLGGNRIWLDCQVYPVMIGHQKK